MAFPRKLYPAINNLGGLQDLIAIIEENISRILIYYCKSPENKDLLVCFVQVRIFF